MLGARGFVWDQLISTSSLHVRPAPGVYPKQKSLLHFSPWPFMCQLGITALILVFELNLMFSGNLAIRDVNFFDHWQAISYVMITQGSVTPTSTERMIKSMLQYLEACVVYDYTVYLNKATKLTARLFVSHRHRSFERVHALNRGPIHCLRWHSLVCIMSALSRRRCVQIHMY